MSNTLLTLEPEFGLEESIGFKTLITPMESGLERRRAKWTYGLRSYRLKLFAYTKSDMDTVWDFYIARKGAYDTFIVKIPTEYTVTTEAIGTGDGVATQFMLDEFPVDTTAGTFTMYVDSVEATATLSNNFSGEFSYVTFSSAPANEKAITGDYEFCFRVRFAEDNLTRELLAYQLLSAGILLREVRWTTYRPRAGNAYLLKIDTYDSITIADYEEEYKFRAVSEYEEISIAESITTYTDIYHKIITDSITIAESVTMEIKPIPLTVNDSASIAEHISTVHSCLFIDEAALISISEDLPTPIVT